jgi:hypothetical protein
MAEDSAKLLIDVQLVEGAEAVQRLDQLESRLKNVKDKGKQATLSAKEFDNAFSLVGVDAGISKIQQSGKEFAKLGKTFKGAIKGTKGFKGALRGVKGAIMSTGLGLLVVLLGEAVQLFASWASGADAAAEANKRFTASLEKSATEQSRNLQLFDAETEILRMRGADEQELTERARLRYNQEQQNLLANIDAHNEMHALMMTLTKGSDEYNQLVTEMNANHTALENEKHRLRIQHMLLEEQMAETHFNMEKKRLTELAQERKKARDAARERFNEELDHQNMMRDMSQTVLDEMQEELDAKAQMRQDAYDGELEDFEEFEEELAEVEERFEMDRRMRRRTRTKQEIEEDKALRDAKIAMGMEVLGALSAAQQLFGEEGSAAAKALALADIAAGTAVGFIQALDIAQKGASGTGPAAPFTMPIFYASQIAAVLGAAAQAKSILQGGGASGGGSFGGRGGSASFTSALIPDGGQGLPAPQGIGAGGAGEMEPIQAYVMEGEITNAQAVSQELQARSSL